VTAKLGPQIEALVQTTQITSDQAYQIREQLAALAPEPDVPSSQRAAPLSQPFLGTDLSQLTSLLDPAAIARAAQSGGAFGSQPPGGGGAANPLQGIDPNLLASLANAASNAAPRVDPKQKAYDDAIMNIEIRLTTSDLQKCVFVLDVNSQKNKGG
jgi:hypothetical protein